MAASKRPRLNGLVNRVKLVGIELEGGWDAVPAGESVVKDGSVKFPPSPARPSVPQRPGTPLSFAQYQALVSGEAPPPSHSPSQGPAVKGEIVSKPLHIDKIAGWVKHAYPAHVNETCGLHVHMSFYSKLNYSRLMTPAFIPWMVSALTTWATTEHLPPDHPQWRRFDPQDPWTLQHCAHTYLGEAQARMIRKDWESRGKPYSRYTFVNYCDGQHHTVEVRGISMPPTHAHALRAIMTVITATNEFLSKIKQKETASRVRVRQQRPADRVFRSFAA